MAVAQATAPDSNRGGDARGPKVVELGYKRWYDGHSLQAHAYRTDKLGFITSYEGKRASAGSRYRPSITDTDIDAKGEARHPWESVKDHRVLKLVRESLRERGTAKVRIRARRERLVDDVRIRIDLSECSQDPPLYPVDCEVEV